MARRRERPKHAEAMTIPSPCIASYVGNPLAPVRNALQILRLAGDNLAMLLRLLGQDVRTAHDGYSALEAARAAMPEVAFLDIGLPGMSGHELARRLRGEPDGGRVLL